LACGYAPTAGSLLAFRFFGGYLAWFGHFTAEYLHRSIYTIVGLASAAPMAVVGGSIDDLFSRRDRAVAMSIFIFMPLIGALV